MTRFHALLVFLLVGPLYFNDSLIAQPQVIRVKPEAGSTGVPLYVPGLIEMEFDQPMNRTSVINAIETETDPPLPPFVQALRVLIIKGLYTWSSMGAHCPLSWQAGTIRPPVLCGQIRNIRSP